MGCCVSSSAQVASQGNIVVGIFGLNGSGKETVLQALTNEGVREVNSSPDTITYRDISVKLCDSLARPQKYVGETPDFSDQTIRTLAELWGFLFVVDSTDPCSFNEAYEQLEQIKEHRTMVGKPYAIIGNKQGAPGAGTVRDLQLMFGTSEPIYGAGSRKRDKGVVDAISYVIEKIQHHAETISLKVQADVEKYREQEKKRPQHEVAEKEDDSYEYSGDDYISPRK